MVDSLFGECKEGGFYGFKNFIYVIIYIYMVNNVQKVDVNNCLLSLEKKDFLWLLISGI